MSFTEYYFNLGYNLEKQAMEKTAGRTAATLAGALGPGVLPAALTGALSEDGKGWRTAGAQTLGGIGGGLAGGLLGLGGGQLARYLGGDAVDIDPTLLAAIGAVPGMMAGGAAGAYYGHGEDSKAKK